MAMHYSQPAAANYFTPPTSAPRPQRGYRICDNCGKVEVPEEGRFRLCGGCMTTQYCSQACQKANWQSHKAICQHTAAVVKQHSVIGGNHRAEENLAQNLRKFTSANERLLEWAVFQALQLKRLPANVRQSALLIELAPITSPESHRRFSVSNAHIVPRSYVRDPLVMDEIHRRETRCRHLGGLGAAVVIIQCGAVSEVMPVEVDPPSKITWDSRSDWLDVLRHFVDSGRTDFKPISSTARGVVYGF